MRLQFASDFHFERNPKDTFEWLLDPVAPALALLGDIAPADHPNLPKFLEWCSERWETVLYIPGATELFWDSAAERLIARPALLPEAIERLRRICKPFANIHVLHREAFFTDDGLVVLGCTLWGCLAEQPREFRDLHRADLNWIKAMVSQYPNPYLILSHYGPVPWVQDEDRLWEPADVPTVPEMELLLRKPIVAWAFGHYHGLVQSYKLWNTPGGQTREITLVCNGLGPDRVRWWVRGFRRDAVLRVDPAIYLADKKI
jgi:hypothetical protein